MSRRRRAPLPWLAGLLLGAGAACSADRADVVLIVVDTLRIDHLSAYGAPRRTSPAIESLAASGLRFERAYATAPWTMPSVASILTGLYPSSHGLGRIDQALAPDVPTLAEMLRDAGYRTAAVVSHVLVGSGHGFARGFDRFLESEARGQSHVSTEGVTREAIGLLRELAGGGRPFFLFVHYFDPHYTYQRHAEYGFAAERAGRLRGGEPIRVLRSLAADMGPDEIRLVRDLYDEEIRFTDEGIGLLLDALAELGIEQRTWTILTGDHGEEFLDHGHLGHTRSLYEELVRVPLLLRRPGERDRGRVFPHPVSLISLVPTLLDGLGIDAPATGLQGTSLLPWLETGSPEPPPPPFFEVDFVPLSRGNASKRAHKRGIVVDDLKLIEDEPSGAVELYALDSDPGERRSLHRERPGEVARLRERLESVRVRRHPAPTPDPIRVGETERELLRGLGYVED